MTADADDTAATLAEGARGHRGTGGTLPPGTRVGRYVIQQELAHGGMGVVYRAHDPELDRGVAVKVVRVRAQRSLQARERLLREAQALAQLSHPNVITVHDVGTHGDDVFIAMELVDGESLRVWMRPDRPWRETMEVLLAAGRGLAAAHAAGMVHRDFKPDNVIVGRDGRVRVLDFGLARPALTTSATDTGAGTDPDPGDGDVATDADAADTWSVDRGPGPTPGARLAAPLTAAGRVVGTPRYMSPEQHRGAGLDALSDQFSFCVTAWEALCGRRPFAGETLEALREAKEAFRVEPPIEDARVPARIRRILRRGMAPSPFVRFRSIDALLAALTRAIEAPRRVAIAGAGAGAAAIAAIAALAIGTRDDAPCHGAADRVAEVWSDAAATAVTRAFAATRRPHAARTAQLVDDALDAYARDWAAMRTSSCMATHRGDQSAELLDRRTLCLDRRLEALSALVGVLRAAPDGDVVDHAVEAVLALPDLDACADVAALRAELALPADPALRARVAAIDARLDQVVALSATAQYAEARAIADAAVAEARGVAHPPLLARALHHLGSLQEGAGESDAAAATVREAARVAASAHDDDLTARALLDLVWITGHWQSRYDEAVAMTASVEAAVARAGDPPALRARLDSRLGSLLGAQGKYDEAVPLLERALATLETALGPDDEALTPVLNNLGEVLRAAGRSQDARRHYQRALAISERTLGPEHPDVGALINNLGLTLWSEGKYDEARPLIERSLALDEATFGPDHPRVATSLVSLGGLFQEQGRAAEARPHLERALAIQRRSLGPDHPELAMAVHNLGAVSQLEGDHATAIAYFEEALAIFGRALPADHPHLAHPLAGIGESLVSAGRASEAIPHLRRSVDLQDRAFGDQHPDTAYALTSLGSALLVAGRAGEAVAPLERAIALRTDHPAAPGELAHSQFLLAQALWIRGDRRRARVLAAQARDGYAAPDAGDPDALAGVERWLAAHRQ